MDFSFRLDSWITFVEERWLVILITLVALFLVIKLLNTLIKWVIVVAVVAGLLIYGANYTDAIRDVTGNLLQYTQDEVFRMMEEEIRQAEYRLHEDGSYTVDIGQIRLEGQSGSDEVKITYRGQTFTVRKNDFLERYLTEVRQNDEQRE